MLIAKKQFDNEKIVVTYQNEHINHQPNSVDSWKKQRLPPVVRTWLKELVKVGTNWEMFKNISRPSEDMLMAFESGVSSSAGPVSIPQSTRVTNQHFSYYRRNHLKSVGQLETDCWQSLELYGQNIEQGGGIYKLEVITSGNFKRKETEKDFLYAFSTAWQLSNLRRYSSLLCLDSTHGTCYSLESKRKAFLYSIVIKHNDAGCGIPVAFMITSIETMVPIEIWLRWLKDIVPFEKCPTFMIDCSQTEVAAINAVFNEPIIRFCHWHFFRALSCQANRKIISREDRISALQDFRSLLWTKTAKEFNERWVIYESKYQSHELWLSYLKSQWMGNLEKWWNGYRMVTKRFNMFLRFN